MFFSAELPSTSIKSVNRNLKRLSEEYGNDSRIVQDYRKSFEMILGQDITYEKNGVLRLRNNKATQKAIEEAGEELEEKVQTLPSFGEYQKELRRSFKKEYGESGTQEELSEFNQIKDQVQEASEDGTLQSVLSDQKAADPEGFDGVYSWEELKLLIDDLKKEVTGSRSEEEEEFFRNRNPFE